MLLLCVDLVSLGWLLLIAKKENKQKTSSFCKQMDEERAYVDWLKGQQDLKNAKAHTEMVSKAKTSQVNKMIINLIILLSAEVYFLVSI